MGSKHQKVKNHIYISLFHEDTYRIFVNTQTESQGYMEQKSPPLTPNLSLSELLTALTEHGDLQYSTLRVFISNIVVKSLLPCLREGYY